MSQREDTLKFETGRIKALQEERLHIQKKTFTKWMNSFLAKARMEVEDLFVDLADGRKLLKLLEIISGEKLGKPNSGRMRVHKIENVNKSLAFLHTKVRLESIGAEDIVDGNPRLILGLIWTIILRFQIQEIEIDVDEDNESSEKKSAKDALLLWCQRRTNGYNYVNIQDFTGSWRTGMGFNALIHAHRPDLIDYEQLVPTKHIDNLNNAFDVAERDLGIPRLLDAEDIDTARPDEKSVLTYVASYYHTFARMKNEIKGGRRIANILTQLLQVDKMKRQYELDTQKLLNWINETIEKLNTRTFPNSLEGIQEELHSFKTYRTDEKPPKYNEKSEMEACYFNINSRLKELKQPTYNQELIHELGRSWVALEKAEHERELALRKELQRQKHLEQLALRFEKKSVLREGYLKDMIQVLSDPRYGVNLGQVEATVKKHEAISADIMAREERCTQLTTMSDYLIQQNYHAHSRIKTRADEILATWEKLIKLLTLHKTNLTNYSNLMYTLREIDTITSTIHELEETFKSTVGTHLLAVEDLLQKHSLLESQISAMGETIKRLNRQAQQFTKLREYPLLEKRIEQLNTDYAKLMDESKERRSKLEDSRSYYQFVQDAEEEEAWIAEKQRICRAPVVAKDLRAVVHLQKKHKGLLDDMKANLNHLNRLIEAGQEMTNHKHAEKNDIQERIVSLEKNWAVLQDLVKEREKKLSDAEEAYQYYADSNEADSWITEKKPLVSSTDYGEDEPTAQALLKRHKDLEEEITAYSVDIEALNAQAAKLIKSGISTLETQEEPPTEDWVQEQKLLPQEYWEEEPHERIEYRTVTEERSVPQVKCLYAFQGQDIEITKGEVMFLLNKTNNDWWNVRKGNGQDGFVPANYVKVIEPKVVQVQVRVPETIKDTKRVKKTKMVLQNVMVKKSKPMTRGAAKKAENEPIDKRQARITKGYQEIVDAAKKRHSYLNDSIHLFAFYGECDDFEKWIRDKEKMLQTDEPHETVESAKRKFEQFLTDLSAATHRLSLIDTAVNTFIASKHSQIEKILLRQKQIHALFKHLNLLKTNKEKSLEGASLVELFNRTCDETRDWITEKTTQLDTDELGMDLKTVQALQRRHENLERELAPIQEKLQRVSLLASSVKTSYPHETDNVIRREEELAKLWQQLKTIAAQRRARLEQAVGKQIFMNSSNNLLDWVDDTKHTLESYQPAKDVSMAEEQLKKHSEVGDDLRAHEDEFEEVVKLGASLQKRIPEVTENLVQLQEVREDLHKVWQEKGDYLQQEMDLQMFSREADQIDSATAAHQTFLDNPNVGNGLDEVEQLLKRHSDFEATLLAQEERLKTFSEMAGKLIDAGHYEKDWIHERKNEVLEKRIDVKRRAKDRRKALETSLRFQEFKTDVEEMMDWIGEKMATASDESFKDLANLERKIQKHEAFARELRANEVKVKAINRAGQKLNDKRADELLTKLNEAWDNLRQMSDEKGNKLRQAEAQHSYFKTVDNIKNKLDEIESSLAPKPISDRRNCKEQLKKHATLESDLANCDTKVQELIRVGEEMVYEGHYDADNIKKQNQEMKDKFDKLKKPTEEKREALAEALRYYDFLFEVDGQLQWIQEHQPASELPQDMYTAQSLNKKQKKLESEIEGHEPVITALLEKGKQLPKRKEVDEKCKDLNDAWRKLKDSSKDRSKRLELALKAQQFFSDAAEVESWINEKSHLVTSTDYGKDKDACVKLLTKHKTLELEMDTYSGLLAEMLSVAQTMVNSQHPDSKTIENKQETLQAQMKKLQKAANERRLKLIESMQKHEYFAESSDFEKWIDDAVVIAMSEDYGHDYEHLLRLQSKFNEFKLNVESNGERFKSLDDLARKLNNPEMDEDILPDVSSELVSQKHEILCDKWNNLLQHIQARDLKLAGAGEIHRFHRDVADALARIQEKSISIPEGVGRDLNSCESMLRVHESFENDLLALEAQLQVLVDDASRLKETYPTNAESIQQEQTAVVDSWMDLQNKAALKRDELQAGVDFHRFASAVRDLQTWCTTLQSAMDTKDQVRDPISAQALMTEHEQLKAEIEAREEKFNQVQSLGEAMIREGHESAQEVKDKMEVLMREKAKLLMGWEKRRIYLDQLIDLHIFLRDAKQLETLCSGQEATLSNPDVGTTVEEVDIAVKKHEGFEKLLAGQEDKFNLLQEQGGKLVRQEHFESPTVRERMSDVANRRENVKKLCKLRKAKLDNTSLYVQFLRDVHEASAWIEERMKSLQVQNKTAVLSLEEKIKKLKKHQAFEAELAANEARIQTILENGKRLKNPEISDDKQRQCIDDQLKQLTEDWKALLHASKEFGRGLEEAKDILEFNNQVEKIEDWMREKEMLVAAADTGRDFEHCQEIIRKLDHSDMRVDDERIREINAMAEKLGQKTRLSQRWVDLKGNLEKYRTALKGALEVHAFNRDVEDTKERIQEKIAILSADEVGKDLEAVEALLRKQDTLERDVSAISNKLEELIKEKDKLMKKYPECGAEAKLESLQTDWDNLSETCLNKRNALNESLTFQKFNKELQELENWADDICEQMSSDEPTTKIETKLQLHSERKGEIAAKDGQFENLAKTGNRLIKEGHSSDKELKESLMDSDNLRQKVLDKWTQVHNKLQHSSELELFENEVKEAEALLREKESFLHNEDLGDSVGSVEALLRKHDEFTSMLEMQLKRVDDVIQLGERYMSESKLDPKRIDMVKQLKSRKKKLITGTEARKFKLEESKALHRFLRNIHEVEGWILEKMQLAKDDSDPTNLPSKIQKHTAFEAELNSNESRVQQVCSEGETLASTNHFASDQITDRVEDLKNLWRQLLEASRLRKERLSETHQNLLFNRTLDDLEVWLDDVEQQLASEDHGKDLASVHHLLKKWQQLENSYCTHAEQMEQIQATALDFQKTNHYLKDEIHERVQAIRKRYAAFEEPLHIRKENLEDALKLYQFTRDVEEELQFLTEKEIMLSSTELGSSLSSAQLLLKKHVSLESEVATHEPFIVGLTARGTQMIQAEHFAAEIISKKIKELQEKRSKVKDISAVRKKNLNDSIQSQTFFSDASEADAYMKERKPYFTSTDLGKDEDSVELLLKKLDVVHVDLTNFSTTIDKLNEQCIELVKKNHFDLDRIAKTMGGLKETYSDLQKLSDKRRQKLIDTQKLYQFIRECDEVLEWIQEQMNIAGSEDYGKDVEHVEILIQKFESFLATLNEQSVTSIQHSAEQLIQERHPEPAKIQAKAKEVQQMWDEFKELSAARQEALHGAKQVHTFGRRADETIGWIVEKDLSISTEDFGHDLESVQALIRKQQGFEMDLAAVKEAVGVVVSEAKRLAQLYPDAHEHISAKHEETVEAWNELLEKTASRKDKLHQAEQLQMYFDTCRELLAWLNEMIAKVTGPELPKDVVAAERLIAIHKQYQVEIESRKLHFEEFKKRGEKFIADGHFLKEEIEEKVKLLVDRWEYLQNISKKRQIMYEQNLDIRLFLRDVELLDSWLTAREPILKDPALGESIGQVEELLKKHNEFEKTIHAQNEKLEGLKRRTLIEDAFKKQQQDEIENRKLEAKRAEKDRIEAIKRKEVERITEERKKEDRKRTQEINRDDLAQSMEHLARLGPDGDAGLLTDSARRGSDPGFVLKPLFLGDNLDAGDLKRSESFKFSDPNKKPKRTPSFTTRRRTQSFRNKKDLHDLPPVVIEGDLERKHEFQSGGKRAALRSWRHYHVVLCGQLLCFFKEKDDFKSNSRASATPIVIYQAKCERAVDYTKKKYVFRLKPTDGSEYLFATDSDANLEDWVMKINFQAQLPPSEQLKSGFEKLPLPQHYGDNGTTTNSGSGDRIEESGGNNSNLPPHVYNNAQNQLLQNSSNWTGDGQSTIPDPHKRAALVQPRSREPVYANVDVLKESSIPESPVTKKPPIPPRTSSIESGHEVGLNGSQPHTSPQNGNRNGNGNNGSTDDLDGNQWKRHSFDRVKLGGPPPPPIVISDLRQQQQQPPYYPGVQLPQPHIHSSAPHGRFVQLQAASRDMMNPYHQVYAAGAAAQPHQHSPSSVELRSSRTASLPPGSMPPTSSSTSHHHRQSLDTRRTQAAAAAAAQSDSSSESDSPSPSSRGKEKKSSGLMGLFRRKKATQL